LKSALLRRRLNAYQCGSGPSGSSRVSSRTDSFPSPKYGVEIRLSTPRKPFTRQPSGSRCGASMKSVTSLRPFVVKKTLGWMVHRYGRRVPSPYW
jgi:hypothetical protein